MTSLQGSKTVQVKLILCFSFCMIAQFWASAAHAQVLSIPPNTSETTQVGASRFADWIYAGSRGFSALEQIGISPGVVLATGLPPDARVQSELRESLFRVRTAASLATTVEIEVIKAWVQPPPLVPLPNDLSNGLYYEGRAIDFVIKDPAGMATVDTVFTLLGASTDFKTNYLQLVDAAGPVPKHIHMSIAKAESRKLAVSVGDVVSGSDSDGLSKNYWDGVKNSGESDLIDEFISQFRGTASASAAFSERYTALRKSSNDFFTKYPQKYAELTSTQQAESLPKYSLIVADYHQFLSAHTGTVGAYVALTDLLRLRRWENNPIGYLDFIKRFPASAESQIAMECLYQVETELLLKQASEKDFDDRPRFVDYDRFLQRYPNAVQWSLIATLAINYSVENDNATIISDPQFLSQSSRDDRAMNYLGVAVECFRELQRLAVTVETTSSASPAPAGSTTPASTTESRFSDLGRAKYFLWHISRIQRLLSANYANSDANARMLELQLEWETNQKLDDVNRQLLGLRREIERAHNELTEAIRNEFEATRNVLNVAFEELSKTITDNFQGLRSDLNTHFKNVREDFAVLHRDVVVIQGQMVEAISIAKDTRAAVSSLSATLDDTNKRLDSVVETQGQLASSLNNLQSQNQSIGIGLQVGGFRASLSLPVPPGLVSATNTVVGAASDAVSDFGNAVASIGGW